MVLIPKRMTRFLKRIHEYESTVLVADARCCVFRNRSKGQPGPQPDMELLLAQTEQLEFSVHYGFLTLGWVTIEPVKDTLYNQQEAYTFRTVIKAIRQYPLWVVRRGIITLYSVLHQTPCTD